MTLSRFFTLDEMTFSNTAKAEGIDNTPSVAEIESLRALCTAVLDPLREALGSSIKVNSGYRGPKLNARLKGAAKSQHLIGQAADIQAKGVAVVDLFKKIIQLGLPFDQIIYEVKDSSKWVHVSHNPGANAGQIMLGKFEAGRWSYPRLTAEQALALPGEPVTRSRGAAVLPGYIEGADEPESEESAPKVSRNAPAKKAAKTAAKRAPAKKAPAKKAAVKKTPVKKKAAAKKVAAKPAAKKPAAKKTAKKPARKPAAKKPAAKKAAPKKTVVKRGAGVKKTAAKKRAGKTSR